MEGLLFCNPGDITECCLKCDLRTGCFFRLHRNQHDGGTSIPVMKQNE
jgi:hypothetical protein